MPFYALATVPLIQKLTNCHSDVVCRLVTNADDAAVCSKIMQVKPGLLQRHGLALLQKIL